MKTPEFAAFSTIVQTNWSIMEELIRSTTHISLHLILHLWCSIVTYFYNLLQNESRRAGIAWEGEAVYFSLHLYFMYSPCLKTSSSDSNVRHYFRLVTFNATNIISRQNKLTLHLCLFWKSKLPFFSLSVGTVTIRIIFLKNNMNVSTIWYHRF